MSFLLAVALVWALFLVAWIAVSRYFKSSDASKIKERLSGGGNKAKKVKVDALGSQSVIHTQDVATNKFAQLLVEKYRVGPRILMLLEQAGLKWPPARLVHLCLVGFGAGTQVNLDGAHRGENRRRDVRVRVVSGQDPALSLHPARPKCRPLLVQSRCVRRGPCLGLDLRVSAQPQESSRASEALRACRQSRRRRRR